MYVWDIVSGVQIRMIECPDSVAALTFLPGTGYAAAACGDMVRLVDINTGELIATLGRDGRRIRAIAAPSVNNRLLTGSDDRTARLWDTKSGRELVRMDTHGSAVRTLCTDRKLSMCVTGCEDGSIRVWALPTGQLIRVLWGEPGIFSMALLPDDRTALCIGGEAANDVFTCDLRTGRATILPIPDGTKAGLALAPDHDLAVIGWGGGEALVVPIKSSCGGNRTGFTLTPRLKT